MPEVCPKLKMIKRRRTQSSTEFRAGRRPTYAQWIAKAIASTPDRAMTLADINEWMIKHVPGLAEQRYLHSCKGWKNAVRHTLSINRHRFTKVPQNGKPSLWSLNASVTAAGLANIGVGVLGDRGQPSPALIASAPVAPRRAETVSADSELSLTPSLGVRNDYVTSVATEMRQRASSMTLPSTVVRPAEVQQTMSQQPLAVQQLEVVSQLDGSIKRLLLPSPLPLTDVNFRILLGQSLVPFVPTPNFTWPQWNRDYLVDQLTTSQQNLGLPSPLLLDLCSLLKKSSSTF